MTEFPARKLERVVGESPKAENPVAMTEFPAPYAPLVLAGRESGGWMAKLPDSRPAKC